MRSTIKCLSAVFVSSLLAACGNADPGTAAAGASAEQTRAGSQKRTTMDAQGFINAFSFRATGDAAVSWDSGDLRMSGGCPAGSPMSIGFSSGTVTAEDYRNVAFDTQAVIAPGQTGTFPLEEIRWDHGTKAVTPRGGGTEVRVPNRFAGPGTLTLTTHEATTRNRRLSGTARGEGIKSREGALVDLVVEFDLNLSCGALVH